MPIQKLILTYIVLASALLGSVLAADKPATQADVEKLQEQVRTLDKELAVQREAFVRKLDDVEKRQSEITAQQANSLAAIANQTTSVGNYIANTSIVVTLLLVIAGLITFFNAKSKVVKEARLASADWFKENAVSLQVQIATLRTEAEKLIIQMQTQASQVRATATTLQGDMSAAASAVLNFSKDSTAGEISKQVNPQAVQVVAEASQSLKSKPESEFTAADFFTRGLSHFSNKDFTAALSAFDSAIELSSADTAPDRVALYLLAKGITLGRLDKPQDAIAMFEQLDRRFGADTTPAVRKHVAVGLFIKGMSLGRAEKLEDKIAVYDNLDRRFGTDTTAVVRELVVKGLNGAGFSRILLAKQCWHDEERRVELLVAATDGLTRAVLERSDENLAIASGRLGYALFLLGQHMAAEEPTLACLRLGGQKMLEAQRKDATLHRVEPEDSQYEELLARLWQSLPAAAPNI